MLAHGTKIQAKFVSVESVLSSSSTNTQVLGYSNTKRGISYKIIAQWLNPTDNQMYVFKSDDLSYNPESLLVGKEIEVYIDPINPKRYYLDISNLPKLGN